MAQKEIEKRPRGRPRAFTQDVALRQALETFWDRGYSGTSLDTLSAAMQINRPSLYSSFGDKEALYLQALERYRAEGLTAIQAALSPQRPLRESLKRLYAGAITLYMSGENGSRGCFLIGTAGTEAVQSAAIRKQLAASLHDFDDAFEVRLRRARTAGEIRSNAKPAALARLASGVLHTLAVRARAGESRAALKELADSAVDLICAD